MNLRSHGAEGVEDYTRVHGGLDDKCLSLQNLDVVVKAPTVRGDTPCATSVHVTQFQPVDRYLDSVATLGVPEHTRHIFKAGNRGRIGHRESRAFFARCGIKLDDLAETSGPDRLLVYVPGQATSERDGCAPTLATTANPTALNCSAENSVDLVVAWPVEVNER